VDFEVYLTRLLKKLGFEDVTGTSATGDQGADLLAKKDGRKIAIQAKRYKGRVGNEAVQEVVGALKFYKADEGWVITSGRFTQSARAWLRRMTFTSLTAWACGNSNRAERLEGTWGAHATP
jgi:restriction system protein